ncbi:VOC family protein [Streptomonospora litoralis]|uniref:Glyoxalase-like domain protein n=1 Tax=Streptomonospora litoralis TaxID=2498135 RepID=A0A4P6Q6U5_9ACTN|nr:VOC family protein [Streptomonospora litoralis]QBI56403.1 Glyoxalase-like domain protein [Streptomonospora litoralis]
MTADSSDGVFTGIGRMVVLVDDLDSALSFYRDVLGFGVLFDQTAGGYRYLHIGVPGQPTSGLWLMPAGSADERALVGRQSGGQPLLVLYTDDLDRVRERLAASGVPIWAERDDADHRSLHFADLYGNTIVAAQLHAAPL